VNQSRPQQEDERIHTALEDLDVETLRRRLAAAVSRACPRWLRQEREDLVQTTLLRIYEAGARADGTMELRSAYFWKAAQAVTIDEIRRARWRYERALDDESGGERATESPDPERSARAAEFGRKVRECLETLDGSRRHAVQLRLAGFGHDEAARLLGRSVKQISNLVFRGMQELRACLREKGVSA
jgi:RNA polymerase sigma-70 factor (ECF subfamily)